MPYHPPESPTAAKQAIIAVGRAFDARGWAPATSGNYSVRLADGRIAVTVSGAHKGRLDEDDVMLLAADGTALEAKRPSAETALHLALYAHSPAIGAVLHSHSSAAVGLSRARRDADHVTLAGHEMLKALPGVTTHAHAIAIPIVANSQDMAEIDAALGGRIDAAPAYLIRDHGLYAWGGDIAEAERVTEAIEWMIAAELAELTFAGAAR
ncbi:methylthioribulose 1-phosphate dehydratase [Sphingomonas flavalba]|uniref:methylthioribulose 1-phosphate dehydratase n=1 Tax=Sphingomonas flavalba TaxID=2559804 RepID=UPI0039E04FC0